MKEIGFLMRLIFEIYAPANFFIFICEEEIMKIGIYPIVSDL